MKIRPGVSIKKENPEDHVFIIDDSLITWVHTGINEWFCTVPDTWTGEVVAVIIQKYEGMSGEFEMVGVVAGKTQCSLAQLNAPYNKFLQECDVQRLVGDGKAIYNGSVYKLVSS